MERRAGAHNRLHQAPHLLDKPASMFEQPSFLFLSHSKPYTAPSGLSAGTDVGLPRGSWMQRGKLDRSYGVGDNFYASLRLSG